MSDQLTLIHSRQRARYADTIARCTKYLIALARRQHTVSADDAVAWMLKHRIEGDRRLLGALFTHGPFVAVKMERSRRRRGWRMTWRVA